MADPPAVAPKPAYDAQGREVFTVHPQILSGGAPYRKITEPTAPVGAATRVRTIRRRPVSDVDR